MEPATSPPDWKLEWYYFGDLITVYTGNCNGKDVSAELSQYLGSFDASAAHREHLVVAFTRLVNSHLGFNLWKRDWPKDLKVKFRSGLTDVQLHPTRLVLPLPFNGFETAWTRKLIKTLYGTTQPDGAEDADAATLRQVNLFMDAADALLKPSPSKPPFTKEEIEKKMQDNARANAGRNAEPLPESMTVRGAEDGSSHDHSNFANEGGTLVAEFGLKYDKKECPPGGFKAGGDAKAGFSPPPMSDFPCGNLCFRL